VARGRGEIPRPRADSHQRSASLGVGLKELCRVGEGMLSDLALSRVGEPVKQS
jgi:hypothetical protein